METSGERNAWGDVYMKGKDGSSRSRNGGGGWEGRRKVVVGSSRKTTGVKLSEFSFGRGCSTRVVNSIQTEEEKIEEKRNRRKRQGSRRLVARLTIFSLSLSFTPIISIDFHTHTDFISFNSFLLRCCCYVASLPCTFLSLSLFPFLSPLSIPGRVISNAKDSLFLTLSSRWYETGCFLVCRYTHDLHIIRVADIYVKAVMCMGAGGWWRWWWS